MNGLYTILLFLFVFGAVTQGINEMGVFDIVVPTNGAKLNETVISEVQSGATTTSINPFQPIMIGISFMKVLGAGIVAMFFVYKPIIDIFTMVGADGTMIAIFAQMLQMPLTFITLVGLFEWWTGRSVT
jgi:hypothetical protein